MMIGIVHVGCLKHIYFCFLKYIITYDICAGLTIYITIVHLLSRSFVRQHMVDIAALSLLLSLRH